MKKSHLFITVLFISCLKIYAQNSTETEIDSTSTIKSKPIDDVELIYINAVNFDFGNTKNDVSYFGHINYFFNIKKDDELTSKHFINTGLMKVNYYSDNLNKGSFHQYDNVLENPLDPTTPGSPYIREYNQYDFDIKMSSYSAYLQYLYKIGNKYNSIFLHLHGELLLTNFDANVNITTLQETPSTLPTEQIIPVVPYLEKETSFSSQDIGGYFGAGLTGKFKFGGKKDNSTSTNYFIQGTIGGSNTKINPKLFEQNTNNPPKFEETTGAKPFFIIHSYFENNLTGINLIIGTQIRGNFSTAPLYTFYAGLCTSLDKVRELFN